MSAGPAHATWVVALLAAGGAHAQSLEEFVASARQHGLRGRAARLTVDAREADAEESWLALLPRAELKGAYARNQYETSVTFPTGAGPETTTAVIVPQNQLDASVRVDLPLVDVNRWTRIQTARAGAGEARQEAEQARSDETRSVISAYFDVRAAAAIRAAADRATDGAALALEQARARRAAGRANALDVERATTELERLHQVAAESRSAESSSIRRLASLSGLAVTAVSSAGEELAGPEPTRAAVVDHPLDEVPAVATAREQTRAARATADAARSALYPTLGANAQERLTNATGFLGKTASWSAGVELSWKLDASVTQGLRSADATAEAARVRELEARRDAADRIADDWDDVTALTETVTAARAEQASAATAALLARERAAAGALTPADVIQSDRDALSAEARRIRAEARLAAARLFLRVDAGLPLALAAAGARP